MNIDLSKLTDAQLEEERENISTADIVDARELAVFDKEIMRRRRERRDQRKEVRT